MNESPLFTRAYDFLLWLIPHVQQFPRKHRFGLAERIQTTALNLQDSLVAAGKSYGQRRVDCLQRADIQLAQLRIWIRMARDLECLTVRQYEHAANLIDEVGRLLGAWIKDPNPPRNAAGPQNRAA